MRFYFFILLLFFLPNLTFATKTPFFGNECDQKPETLTSFFHLVGTGADGGLFNNILCDLTFFLRPQDSFNISVKESKSWAHTLDLPIPNPSNALDDSLNYFGFLGLGDLTFTRKIIIPELEKNEKLFEVKKITSFGGGVSRGYLTKVAAYDYSGVSFDFMDFNRNSGNFTFQGEDPDTLSVQLIGIGFKLCIMDVEFNIIEGSWCYVPSIGEIFLNHRGKNIPNSPYHKRTVIFYEKYEAKYAIDLLPFLASFVTRPAPGTLGFLRIGGTLTEYEFREDGTPPLGREDLYSPKCEECPTVLNIYNRVFHITYQTPW